MRSSHVASIVGALLGAAFLVLLRATEEWQRWESWPQSVRLAMLVWIPVSFGAGGFIYSQWPGGTDLTPLRDYGKWTATFAVAFGLSALVEAAYSQRIELVVYAVVAGVVSGLGVAFTSRLLRHDMNANH